VGALGAPYGIVLAWIIDKLFKCGFHNTVLSSSIKSAYHALTLNEHRWPFRPTRWELNSQHQDNLENFQEKWFPGVHSDVGGGYPDTGLADIALEWMAKNAEVHGMVLDFSKIANPEFKPDPKGIQHNSQTLFYRLATLIFVKLPSFVGIAVPGDSRALIRFINLKGDFQRPVE